MEWCGVEWSGPYPAEGLPCIVPVAQWFDAVVIPQAQEWGIDSECPPL